MLWKYCSYLALAVSMLFGLAGIYVMVTTSAIYLAFLLLCLSFGTIYVAEGCIRKYNEQQLTLSNWEIAEMHNGIEFIDGPEPGDADYEGPEIGEP